jgi:hypothetical protein
MMDPVEFRERGFCVARGFFDRGEAAALLAAIQGSRRSDAPRDALTDGNMIFDSTVFRRSEEVRQAISKQKIIDLIKPITGPDVWVRWDQAVTKAPGAGDFQWHQDNAYNGLPVEHFQLWIALTETRNANGTLWLAPGSHKRGQLPHERVPGRRQLAVRAPVGQTVCVDADVGDVVLFSSLMLHRTGPNHTDSTRVAYVVEYMRYRDWDAWLEGPFFMAFEGGRSKPHFVDKQPGARTLRNQLIYLAPRAKRLFDSATKRDAA